MPADNPLPGETWEMTDPQTGEVAQAVVTDADAGAVRLIARLGRRLAMPRRSFLMTWRFVREAPEAICAHGTCNNPGYLQVNDLGVWVMVCPDHLPAWVSPLLPTDDPEGDLDRCPLCGASTHSSSSNAHEIEGVLIQHCGSCDCYWISLRSNSEEEDPATALLDHGVQLAEAIADTAPLLEQRGLRARGVIGVVAWERLRHAQAAVTITDDRKMNIQGVELVLEPRLGEALVLIGDRPRTGVQQLGGQPGRRTNDTMMGVPERGSTWVSRKHPDMWVRVMDVSIGDVPSGPGQRITVKGHTLGPGPSKELSWGLQDFLSIYIQQPSKSNKPEPPPATELPPCEVGEEWIDPSNNFVKVTKIDAEYVVVAHESGHTQTIPIYIFKTRYRKAPPRRSIYQRLMEDE